jgi:hypothetical protein
MGCYKTIEDIAAICGGIECLIIIDIYPHFMHCVGYLWAVELMEIMKCDNATKYIYTLMSCWTVALSSPWFRRNAFSAAVLEISNSFIWNEM